MKIENDTGKVQSSFLSPFTNRVTPKLAKGHKEGEQAKHLLLNPDD